MQVPNDEFGGAAVIKDHVGYTLQILMAGDGYRRNREFMREHRVDQDEALGAAPPNSSFGTCTS